MAAGPVSTHVYWMLGGTWGLYTRGVRDEVATTGTRVVAAVVVLLLVAAVLVVLARVELWQQAFVSDRVIRFFAWTLAADFLVETLAAFTWSRGEELWWMYGPVLLVIAALALVVAGSGSAWPRFHRQHWTRPHTEGRRRTIRGIGRFRRLRTSAWALAATRGHARHGAKG